MRKKEGRERGMEEGRKEGRKEIGKEREERKMISLKKTLKDL